MFRSHVPISKGRSTCPNISEPQFVSSFGFTISPNISQWGVWRNFLTYATIYKFFFWIMLALKKLHDGYHACNTFGFAFYCWPFISKFSYVALLECASVCIIRSSAMLSAILWGSSVRCVWCVFVVVRIANSKHPESWNSQRRAPTKRSNSA